MAKLSRPNEVLIAALVAAGYITDPRDVRRVVIDIRGDQPPAVYVQHWAYADDSLANIVAALASIEPAPLVDHGQPPAVSIAGDRPDQEV